MLWKLNFDTTSCAETTERPAGQHKLACYELEFHDYDAETSDTIDQQRRWRVMKLEF
jgi:hypothetical protein